MSWLIKKFPNRPPPLSSVPLKIPSPFFTVFACTRNPVERNFFLREVTVARLFSAIIGESLWRWSLLSVGVVVKLFGNSLIFVSSIGSWLIFNPLPRISSNLHFWGGPFRYFNQNVRIYILKGVNCWYGLDKRIHQLNWKLVDSNLFPHRPIIRLGLFPV